MKHRIILLSTLFPIFILSVVFLFFAKKEKRDFEKLKATVSKCQNLNEIERLLKNGPPRILPSSDVETLMWYGMKSVPPLDFSNLTAFVFYTRTMPINCVFAFVDPKSSNLVSVAYGHP